MNVASLTIWLRLQAMVWTPSLLLVAVTGAASWAAWHRGFALLIGVSAVALVVVLRCGRRVADMVTLLRLGLLIALLTLEVVTPTPWLLWLLAVGITLLDLLDGALARRLGPTAAGAVLDMEADQFTVLGLSLLAIGQGAAPHVLVLPAMRYAFVLAAWWIGVRADDPKPVEGDNRRGRLVCALVVVALLTALLPGLSAGLRDGVTAAAVLALAWSFASDWRFLRSRRSARRRAG